METYIEKNGKHTKNEVTDKEIAIGDLLIGHLERNFEMVLCDEHQCTGCGTCVAICRFKAIKLKTTQYGDHYPWINSKKCVNCKMCEKTCPSLNLVNQALIKKCYAAASKQEGDQIKCSSGGIATLLMRHIYEAGGNVYSCIFDEKTQKFEISMLDSQKKVSRAKGSKYVASELSPWVLQQMHRNLLEGKKVLFIGLPCQVAAVKAFCKDNNNLFLVDLICHGVPPQKVLLNWLEGRVKGKVANIVFRGSNGYELDVMGQDGSRCYSGHYVNDLYYYAFLQGYTYQNACYQCKYAGEARVGDITIGDFWELDRSTLELVLPEKVSVVLTNTEKGEKLYSRIQGDVISEERNKNEAIRGNPQLNSPMQRPRDLDVYRRYYPTEGLYALKHTRLYVRWLTTKGKVKLSRLKKALYRFTKNQRYN